MLCEKCQKNEARIVVTRTINGVSQSHHLCQECASSFRLSEEIPAAAAEWSKAVFKMISDAIAGKVKEGLSGAAANEKLKNLACPGCNKSYSEFTEDGVLGCPDCYEAFENAISPAILSLQGADTHMGKKSTYVKRKVNIKPKKQVLKTADELDNLRAKMNEAVSIEDYETAAKLRDRIREIEEARKNHE